MKLNTWAAVAATCCMVSTAAAMGMGTGPPPRPSGKPAKLEDFKWADPFASRRMKKFSADCSAEKTFSAREYLLDDVSETLPNGLKPWSDALKKLFSGRAYPGSWEGIDPHGYDRNLLMMEYSEVPIAVREWIEDQERNDGEGKGLFGVYEKPKEGDDTIRNVVKFASPEMAAGLRPLDQKRVAIFAPGAVYDILPLWVAGSSKCKDTMADISKYSPKLSEGGVVAWTAHTKANRKAKQRDMTFTVKAQVLKAQEEAAEAEKDEL